MTGVDPSEGDGMSGDHTSGIRLHMQPGWNPWWIGMWFVFTPAWFAFAFILDVTVSGWLIWLATFTALFLVPEAVSISKRDDALPPLTHTIRHYLPNDFAFPLIYGALGAISARFLGLELWRYLGTAVAVAALGWLTTHFTVTYARPDPHPLPHLQPGPEPQIQDPHPV
jgi:hypothetical protein